MNPNEAKVKGIIIHLKAFISLYLELFCAISATIRKPSYHIVAFVAQIRRSIGGYLRKIRSQQNRPLDEIVVELKDLDVNCSKSNLARIERDVISCRTEILAGLCKIYGVTSDSVLFRG